MRASRGPILGLALSALCLFLVFRKVDLPTLAAHVAAIQPGYFLASVGVFLSTFLLRAWRWKAVLDVSARVPYRRAFTVMMIGYLANNVLPARLGELVRAYVLSRKTPIRKTTTLATILLERVFDGLSLLAILGLFLTLHVTHLWRVAPHMPPWVVHAGLIAATGFVAVFGVLWALAVFPRAESILSGMLGRVLPVRLAGKAQEFLGAFASGVHAAKSPGRLATVFGLSLLVWLLEGTTYHLMGQAFGFGLSWPAFVVVMVLVNLGTIVPSAPGLVGTFQFFSVLALGVFGVAQAPALGYGLVLNMAEFLPVTLIGVACMAFEHVRFDAVLHPEAGDAEGEPSGPSATLRVPPGA